MKTIYLFAVVLVLSVGVVGQTNDLHGHKCLETIPAHYADGVTLTSKTVTIPHRPVWLTWRISECGQRPVNPNPGNRERVTIEDVVAKNILVTDDMVVVHPREWSARSIGIWNGEKWHYVGELTSKPAAKKRQKRTSYRDVYDLPRYAHAQAQKAVVETPATTTYVLNPEASAAYVEIAKRIGDLQKEIGMLQGQAVALMVATGIPASERDRQPTLGKDGTVSFAPKKPEVKAETPKP